jgi:hypothetical protein
MRANIPTGSYGALGLCSTPAKSVWREPFFSWRISGKSVGRSRSRQRSAKRRSRRLSGRSIRPATPRTVCVLLFPVARNIKLPVRKQPQLVDAELIEPVKLAGHAAFRARRSVPVVFPRREFTVADGLLSYGTSLTEAYRHLASIPAVS